MRGARGRAGAQEEDRPVNPRALSFEEAGSDKVWDEAEWLFFWVVGRTRTTATRFGSCHLPRLLKRTKKKK